MTTEVTKTKHERQKESNNIRYINNKPLPPNFAIKIHLTYEALNIFKH